MSFAKVQIVGNLGQDPETRYTPNGTLNVRFSMAVNSRRRSNDQQGTSQESTTWFTVTAWDRQAERIINMVERGYIAKGRTLYVDGTLEARPWTDNNGNQRTSLDVTLTDWQFVGGGRDQQSGGAPGQGQQNAGQDGGGAYGGSNYGSSYGGQTQPGGQDPSGFDDVPF